LRIKPAKKKVGDKPKDDQNQVKKRKPGKKRDTGAKIPRNWSFERITKKAKSLGKHLKSVKNGVRGASEKKTKKATRWSAASVHAIRKTKLVKIQVRRKALKKNVLAGTKLRGKIARRVLRAAKNNGLAKESRKVTGKGDSSAKGGRERRKPV